MKRLFLTTAIVAVTALPVAAQTNTDTQSSDMMQGQIGEGVTLEASHLIGQRLYMPQQGGQADGQTGMETQPADDMEMNMADNANIEVTDNAATETVREGAEMAEDAATKITEKTSAMTSDGAQSMDSMMTEGIADTPQNWEMVGDIDDVILSGDGEVRGLVVDAGGVLGMNERSRRVDMENLRFVRDSDDEGEYFVIYTGDRATFEQGENIDDAILEEQGETRASANLEGSEREQVQTVSLADITTEELLGTAAYGADDEWLGEISELSMSNSGEIDQVIIDVGGFLGIGEKPVALSIDEVELRRTEGDELRAYLPHTEDELDTMETWESEAKL